MKFLVDAQLPPALCRWLEARGGSAVHVADALTGETSDLEIAAFAFDAKLVIISKDDDFAALHSRSGLQIVWLRLGNASNRRLTAWLDDRWGAISVALEAGESIIEVR